MDAWGEHGLRGHFDLLVGGGEGGRPAGFTYECGGCLHGVGGSDDGLVDGYVGDGGGEGVL